MTISRPPIPIFVLSTGFLLLLVTVLFGWVLVPCFIESQISEQIKLTRGSEVWDKWSNVPIPIYFKIYIFNVTNPDEISKGLNPKFNEVGPYVYREKREKTDIRESGFGTIFYKEKITYFFEQDKSSGLTENDTLTILNVPYVAMSQKVSDLPYPLSYLASVYIGRFKQKAFIQRNVSQILFQGWHLPMIAELEEYTEEEIMPNNTFGLFYGKNGTDDGELEIDAGFNDTSRFGKILSWRGQKHLDWWDSPCNEIKGTDGSIFPPFVTKKRVIEIFNGELCRSLHLTFHKEINFLGIPSYRFTAPFEVLEDPRTNIDNRCFCNDDDLNKCLHGGALDISTCRQGAPVAMSLPHFLDAFEGYINKSGLNPDREKHETRLDIEPTTGLVLRASKKIQINVQMKPVSSVNTLSRLPEMIFPIIWAEETAEIDEEIASELKSKLLTPLRILDISVWTALGLSLGLIWIALAWYLLLIARSRNKIPNIDSDSASSMLKSEGENGSDKSSKQNLDKIFVPLLK